MPRVWLRYAVRWTTSGGVVLTGSPMSKQQAEYWAARGNRREPWLRHRVVCVTKEVKAKRAKK